MGIEDIQISEELETNAPSIKYRGNEGPKSPQEIEQMMMAQLEEEYLKYVDDMMEQGIEPMSMQQFMEQAMAEGDMAGGNPLPQDPTKPVNPFQPKPTGPVLPDRQMAAYGGIMGLDGRRKYGIGSSLKKFVRKVIPNEVAEIAVKAAPFVAPFNPLAAAAMSGLGSFDQTGRIGSSLKSGLMTYGLGQGARYLGGAGMQEGLNLRIGQGTGPRSFFSSPLGNKSGLGKMFANKLKTAGASMDAYAGMGDPVSTGMDLVKKPGIVETITSKISDFIPESTLGKVALGGGALALGTALLGGGPEETVSEIMDRGEGLDIAGIRAEVLDAYKDSSGEKLLALRAKYPFLGNASEKNLAEGGRIGRAEGGLMDLGGMEKDYRAEGGFVPIGKAEKADDVPARLSVNEFVFTADAVRNAGGGDIDKGAEVMENMMKNLEAGGQVSEESQGMAGAQQMFETSERLSEVI